MCTCGGFHKFFECERSGEGLYDMNLTWKCFDIKDIHWRVFKDWPLGGSPNSKFRSEGMISLLLEDDSKARKLTRKGPINHPLMIFPHYSSPSSHLDALQFQKVRHFPAANWTRRGEIKRNETTNFIRIRKGNQLKSIMEIIIIISIKFN